MKTSFGVTHIALLLLITLMYSCSFEKIGSDITKGASSKTKDLSYNLVDGALTRLNNGGEKDSLKNLLKHLLDSTIYNAGFAANTQVVALRNSLINGETKNKLDTLIKGIIESAIGDSTKIKAASLINELLGVKTRMQLAALRNELLGNETNAQIQKIGKDAMAALLNDSVKIRLGLIVSTLRDTLLSQKTSNMVQAIVDSTLSSFFRRVNPGISENLGFIKKYATQILITLALLAAGIIALVWRNRQKYLKAVALLTSHIQNIPDQHIYDELTAKIQSDAVKTGVEPTLRTVLKDNGLLGTQSWMKMQKGK